MAATIVGQTTSYSTTGSTSLDVPVPPGLVVGDVLLVFQRWQAGDSTSYTGPAGFTRLGPYVPASTPGRTYGMWAHVVTDPSSEPSNYTFSIAPNGTRTVAAMVAMRGLDTTNLLAGASASYAGANVGAVVTVAALSSPGPCVQLFLSGTEVTAGLSHIPVSKPAFTELVSAQSGTGTTGSRTAIWAGYRVVEAGSTGDSSIEWVYSGGSPGAQSVLLRVADEPPPVLPGIPVTISVGSTGRIVGTSEGRTISKIGTLRPGFSSVTQMLATPGATWAHRGGSNNWAEMSEFAYDQSALAGYGALEFSAQRTSDGWWFGLHDPDINRAAGTTGLPNASAMTRAQVEAYNIVLNAAGRPRPFFGLIEFLDKWTPSHVVICDLKNAAAFQTEFFDILDTHGGPSKIVAKSYGSSSGFANAATARGYESWGYFYEDNYTKGELAAWEGPWSILGMDIDAPTAWTGANNVLTYNKPVVGHIAASQAKYDLAIAKGASMVQCSNVIAIKPVSQR